MDYKRLHSRRLFSHLLCMPIIWAPLPFMIMLDIVIEIYHHLCFPLCKLEKVKRSAYIQIFDRNRLAYLNIYEKVGCMYCGYGNGLFLYMKEIAGRTEKYWCGIMHADKPGFKTQINQVEQNFSAFGDEADFDKKYL